ncbi:MAG: TRAP transporter small permease [Lachnospiraceae bacterium]|nr:TRAP transporter small permease [Lachnospiraceae bacterium]
MLKSIFDKSLAVLLCTTLVSMVFVAFWGVFTRLVLKNQASFTTEYLRYALLWTSLLAGAYCFGEKGHISITFVKDKFKGNGLKALNVVTELVIIFFAVTVLILGGIQGVRLGMNEISPTLFIRIGYIYTVLPISGVFVTFYSIVNLMDLF